MSRLPKVQGGERCWVWCSDGGEWLCWVWVGIEEMGFGWRRWRRGRKGGWTRPACWVIIRCRVVQEGYTIWVRLLAWTKYQGSFNATTFWLHNAHATEEHVLTIQNFWPKIIPKCTEECCTCKFPGGDQGWPEPWSSRLSRIHIVLHWYFLPPNIASKNSGLSLSRMVFLYSPSNCVCTLWQIWRWWKLMMRKMTKVKKLKRIIKEILW